MAYTLYDVVLKTARELEVIVEGTATAGATTSITDTVYLQNRYEDDFFNAGQAFILYDAGGAGAAPQGEWGRITDFVKSTGVVTITAVSAAVAAGDRYALMDDTYTLDDLIGAINRVLMEIPIEVVDLTSVDTATNQLEYTLPTGILDNNIEVWIQQQTGDTDANMWEITHAWYIQETTTGTGKLLVFYVQPPYDYDVKLVYRTPHPALYARTDKLRESVDINRVALMSAYRAMLHKYAKRGVVDPAIERRMQELFGRAELMRARNPLQKTEIKLSGL